MYKSDNGYCNYTGDCFMDNVRTVTIPIEQSCIKREFDLTKESIDAIAEAVVKRLRGGADE
jgi:hypothetical protein